MQDYNHTDINPGKCNMHTHTHSECYQKYSDHFEILTQTLMTTLVM